MNLTTTLNSLLTDLSSRASRVSQSVHLPHKITELSMPWHLPGFRFAETMSGHVAWGGQDRPMVFHLTAEAPLLKDYLHSGRTHIAGTVTIDGVVHDAPLQGELWIKLLSRLIRYEFSFRDDKGRLLQFAGQKDLSVLHPVRTLKNMPGEVRDEHGAHVAHAKLRFRSRDLPAFLRSFRPMF